eukprot:7808686-Ditylum_brightwellii.AAC.1
MNTYCKVVAYMLMFQTQLPPDMPIYAIALGSWKLYMSELAISIENKVIKKFEEHNIVIRYKEDISRATTWNEGNKSTVLNW